MRLSSFAALLTCLATASAQAPYELGTATCYCNQNCGVSIWVKGMCPCQVSSLVKLLTFFVGPNWQNGECRNLNTGAASYSINRGEMWCQMYTGQNCGGRTEGATKGCHEYVNTLLSFSFKTQT